MKNNSAVIREGKLTDPLLDIQQPVWNPKTRQWEEPPKEEEVVHSPNAF